MLYANTGHAAALERLTNADVFLVAVDLNPDVRYFVRKAINLKRSNKLQFDTSKLDHLLSFDTSVPLHGSAACLMSSTLSDASQVRVNGQGQGQGQGYD